MSKEKLYKIQHSSVKNVDKFKILVRKTLINIDSKFYVEILKNLTNKKGAAIIFVVLLEYIDEKYFIEITERNTYLKRLVIDYSKGFIQERICKILSIDNDPDIREKALKILNSKGNGNIILSSGHNNFHKYNELKF